MTAVSIFTGAGGLDVGIERAGFDVLSTLEIHPSYCETVRNMKERRIAIPGTDRTYFQHANVIQGDIREISAHDLLGRRKAVDCLVGGPPCQAFSSAGKQDSIFDERGTLVYEYLRLLKEIRPKVFLFENVRGLVTAKGKTDEPGEVLKGLLKMFAALGYSCRACLLNSADYGSPQRRVRCFVLGSSIAAAPEIPLPTHAETPTDSLFAAERRARWTTLGDYLKKSADTDRSHWVFPTEKARAILSEIPDGKGLKSPGVAEATRPNGHWGYRQGMFIADQSKPARTVTGSSSQDWIRLPDGVLRRLTLREVAGLQGFPPEWEFAGTTANQYQQVGNAVPTVFGEVLGKALVSYLKGGWKCAARQGGIEISDEIERSILSTKRDNAKNGAFRARRKRSGEERPNVG